MHALIDLCIGKLECNELRDPVRYQDVYWGGIKTEKLAHSNGKEREREREIDKNTDRMMLTKRRMVDKHTHTHTRERERK